MEKKNIIIYSDYLYHHGIKGQKWGVRRYQNPDGSLTDLGRKRLYDRYRYAYKTHNYDNERYAERIIRKSINPKDMQAYRQSKKAFEAIEDDYDRIFMEIENGYPKYMSKEVRDIYEFLPLKEREAEYKKAWNLSLEKHPEAKKFKQYEALLKQKQDSLDKIVRSLISGYETKELKSEYKRGVFLNKKGPSYSFHYSDVVKNAVRDLEANDRSYRKIVKRLGG